MTGLVLDAGSGKPVAGALVEVIGAGAHQVALTGRDGRYVLQVVWERAEESDSTADLQTTVAAPGYRGVVMKLALKSGAARHDFRLGKEVG